MSDPVYNLDKGVELARPTTVGVAIKARERRFTFTYQIAGVVVTGRYTFDDVDADTLTVEEFSWALLNLIRMQYGLRGLVEVRIIRL